MMTPLSVLDDGLFRAHASGRRTNQNSPDKIMKPHPLRRLHFWRHTSSDSFLLCGSIFRQSEDEILGFWMCLTEEHGVKVCSASIGLSINGYLSSILLTKMSGFVFKTWKFEIFWWRAEILAKISVSSSIIIAFYIGMCNTRVDLQNNYWPRSEGDNVNGSVCLSVRPSVRPSVLSIASVTLSVRPSVW